jgi:hypothetical protein
VTYSVREQAMGKPRPLTWELLTTRLDYNGRTPLEHFEASIELRGDFGCWMWTGGRLRPEGPYGRIWTGREDYSAHRFSYVLHRDDVPEGLTLDHLCREPECVNPWHLEPVTPSVNTRRANGFNPHWKRPGRRLRVA